MYSWMARKGLLYCVENVWHIKAVTLKLRSRSFSHKSRYLSYLMIYQHPVWWFGKPEASDTLWRYDHLTLTSMSRLNFNTKWKCLDFRVLTTIFAVSLLGIVITGRKWCPNMRRLLHGHHVSFKFGEALSVKLKFLFLFALRERVPLR